MLERFDITEPITNQKVLDRYRLYSLSGSSWGVLCDGCMEELFIDADIEISAFAEVRDVEYHPDEGAIMNFAEGEVMGAYELKKGSDVVYFRSVCAKYASPWLDEYINFNESYSSRAEACSGKWQDHQRDMHGYMIEFEIKSMLKDYSKDLSEENAKKVTDAVGEKLTSQIITIKDQNITEITEIRSSIENFLFKTADEVL